MAATKLVMSDSDIVEVLHGSWVETTDTWFCDVVWAGNFEQGDFHLLTGEKPYFVEGLVEEDLGECTLTVKRLEFVRHLVPTASWE